MCAGSDCETECAECYEPNERKATMRANAMSTLCILTGVLLMALAYVKLRAVQNDAFIWSATVEQHNSVDFSGGQYFELKRSNAANITLIVNENSEIASFLRSADGKRVILSIDKVGEK